MVETNIPGQIKNFVSQLPQRLADRLHAAGTLRHYDDGQIIQLRGDVRQVLSIVMTGAMRMGTTGADGSFVSTVVLRPGDCHGELTLFANLPRPLDAEAVGDTTITDISRDVFFHLLDDEPQLRDVVMANLAMQLAKALDRIDSLVRLSLPEQIAQTLLEYSGQTGKRLNMKVKVTHTQLASTMGVTRVSIAGALDRLVAQGLITKAYGHLTITDRPALQSWLAEQSEIEPVYQ